MFGRLATAVLLLAFSSAFAQTSNDEDAPRPVVGIQSFESSRFCREYTCSLDNIEPLPLNGEITDWFYNYRVFPKGTDPKAVEYQMRIGISLTPKGGHPFPQVLVRWFPVTAAPEKELVVVSELIREITGDSKFNTTQFLTTYARSVKYESGPDLERGPSATVGGYTLHLSISRGGDRCRYPQLTLAIDSNQR